MRSKHSSYAPIAAKVEVRRSRSDFLGVVLHESSKIQNTPFCNAVAAFKKARRRIVFTLDMRPANVCPLWFFDVDLTPILQLLVQIWDEPVVPAIRHQA